MIVIAIRSRNNLILLNKKIFKNLDFSVIEKQI